MAAFRLAVPLQTLVKSLLLNITLTRRDNTLTKVNLWLLSSQLPQLSGSLSHCRGLLGQSEAGLAHVGTKESPFQRHATPCYLMLFSYSAFQPQMLSIVFFNPVSFVWIGCS